MKPDEVADKLDSNLQKGLPKKEAISRVSEYGYNRLKERKESLVEIIIEPFTEPMMILLLVTAILFAFLSELIDALALFIIICVMAAVELYQEKRTENSLRSLKQLTVPTATTVRDGEPVEVSSIEIVPGDVILLSAGNRIPADGRLIDGVNLGVDESSLTGESTPSYKDPDKLLSEGSPLADRGNMVFAGTLVTSGKGRAIVVATGAETTLGKIAVLTESIEEQRTPLQIKISQLTKWIAGAVILLTGLTVTLGLLRGLPIVESALVGLSLLVVTIPEDLPILTYVILVVSVIQMARKRALIRRTYSAETLGSTTTICSDKTGTLTQNAMMVSAIYVNGKSFDLQDSTTDLSQENLSQAVQIATLCNDSISAATGQCSMVGNSVDMALIAAVEKLGFNPSSIRAGARLLREEPFDSARKMMLTAHRMVDGNIRLFAKGAPEVVIPKCSYLRQEDRVLPLTEELRKELFYSVNRMAENGLRVLALAYRPLQKGSDEIQNLNEAMTFEGLIGLEDPPRPEVRDAILECKRAGIRTVMITGDHAGTAISVARTVGLCEDGYGVTGEELDRMNDDELAQKVAEVNVFARVTPEHKLRIVKALKARNQTVAVTGDGVNDAPALKEADIGVAMGSGTDVAKEASSMTLADNNFATIVAAVKEGRRLFDNLRKAIRYYLPSKISILTTVFVSTLLGLSTPLLPLQIILMEVINDIQASTTFATEPPELDIMRRPPRSAKEPIVTRALISQILSRAFVIFLGAIAVYMLYLGWGASLEKSRTMVFVTLMLSLTFLAFVSRTERSPIYRLGLMTNRYMLYVLGASILVIFVVTNAAPMQLVFSTVALSSTDWGYGLLFSILATGWIEASKLLKLGYAGAVSQ